MSDFYRVTYWRIVDGAARVTTCDKERATVATVEVATSSYGFQHALEREFPMPGGEHDMNRYITELRRAYQIGRAAKASEVARTIRDLCRE